MCFVADVMHLVMHLHPSKDSSFDLTLLSKNGGLQEEALRFQMAMSSHFSLQCRVTLNLHVSGRSILTESCNGDLDEPCIYHGVIDGERVLFKWQVDNFLLAAKSANIANKAFDLIDAHLCMPMKRQGLVSMYNGLDIQQSRWYIKISVQTWLQIMMEPYFLVGHPVDSDAYNSRTKQGFHQIVVFFGGQFRSQNSGTA